MVKRKRLASSSSKPTSATTTTTVTALQSGSRRAHNGRPSNSSAADPHIDVKRSRSTDSADSTAAPQIRGRSAPSSSFRENGKSSTASMDDFIEVQSMQPHPPETMSPVSDKASDEQQQSQNTADPIELPASAGSTENPSIPQISVTDSSTTDATPSLVNGRATASESLSSLSEIDTVDSEAETERIEEYDEDPEEVDTAQVAVDDEDGGVPGGLFYDPLANE